MSLLVATQTLFRLRAEGDAAAWHEILLLPLAYWYGWALCTPLIFAIGRALRRASIHRVAFLGLHLASAVLVSVPMLAWYSFLMHRLGGQDEQPVSELFVGYLVLGFHYDLLTYAAILGVGIARDYRMLFHERASRALQLENRLIQTQLEVLRMQLRPHFLFNALNAVSALVDEDPAAARRMLARLSGLLRKTLELGDAHEIALREEMELVDSYLDIETCRFGDRLEARVEIAEPCLEARVPPLILQPLVENAVRHGVETSAGRCRLRISGRTTGANLELVVRDHGPGLERERVRRDSGVGIANVQSRIEQMYPGAASLTLEQAPDGGAQAVVRLPLRTSSAPREKLP